jgi:hypothetical protein
MCKEMPVITVNKVVDKKRTIGKGVPMRRRAGLPMVSFQTKNPTLGKIGRALELKMLQYFMTIGNIF